MASRDTGGGKPRPSGGNRYPGAARFNFRFVAGVLGFLGVVVTIHLAKLIA